MIGALPPRLNKTPRRVKQNTTSSSALDTVGFTLFELLFYLFFLSLVVAAIVQSSRSVIKTVTYVINHNRESSTNQYVFQLLRNQLSKVGSYSSLLPTNSSNKGSESESSAGEFVAANPVLIPGAVVNGGYCLSMRRKFIRLANLGSCENGNYDRLVVSLRSNRNCNGYVSRDNAKNSMYQVYDYYVDTKNQLICQNYNGRRLRNGEVEIEATRVLAENVTEFDVSYVLKLTSGEYATTKASDLQLSTVNCVLGVAIVLTIGNNQLISTSNKNTNTSNVIIERFGNITEC